MEGGLALEAQAGPDTYPHPVPLIWFQCIDDVEATWARHDREAAWARDHGDEAHAAERLSYLALAEFHAGNCELAERLIEQSCNAIEERLEVSGRFAFPFAWRSFIDAHRGRLDRAQITLEPLVDEMLRGAKAWWASILLSTLGFVHFAANADEAADKAFLQMRALLDEIGITDGLIDRSEPFHIEVLTRLGRVEDARATLERLERRGDAFPRLWIDATLPRARAIVLAAQGDAAAALAAVEALDAVKAGRLPFELGRALLIKGRLLRRAKQRRAAADTLRQAREIFERLGAPDGVEQAQIELEIIEPGRAGSGTLTASELRVARLATSGLTNREIAKAAFMSEKTVEAHLARAYRKLGIHSRAELGARMAAYPQGKR
jgi:DNA-binding NarL/FixJ family response regulator